MSFVKLSLLTVLSLANAFPSQPLERPPMEVPSSGDRPASIDPSNPSERPPMQRPPPMEAPSGTDSPYIVDPWNEVSDSSFDPNDAPPAQDPSSSILAEVLKRQLNPNNYVGQYPGCEDDPSYAEKDVDYDIDQGVKIPRRGDHDECDNGSSGRGHCWTEYFLVEGAIQFRSWRNSGASIDCASTSTCSSASMMNNQTCTAVGTSLSTGTDGTFELGLDLAYQFANGFNPSGHVGGGVTWTQSETNSELTTVCNSFSSTETCTWDDQECHQVWLADRVLHVWGQAQRVCKGATRSKDDEVQQDTQRSNGQWVRGQLGFEMDLPINALSGCSALCGDQTYADPLPTDQPRVPFQAPTGW